MISEETVSTTMKTALNLDPQELLHLALRDIQQSHHDGAISKLKQALEIEADNAQAQFLLAAEYAEIGLYDRAIEGMTRTLHLSPSMHIARFQLGLLYYSKSDFDTARAIWEPLDALGDDAMTLFKTALLLIGAGHQREAIPQLERALEIGTGNGALKTDISKVLQHARAQLDSSENASAPSAHVLARRYDDASGGS
jgi:tetratricopeptide (TPR) repeat protein